MSDDALDDDDAHHDEDALDAHASNFWRQPNGLPPQIEPEQPQIKAEPEPSAPPAKRDDRTALDRAGVGTDPAVADPDRAGRELMAQAAKLEKFLKPQPVSEMKTEVLKELLHEWQADWYRRYGRKVTPDDAAAGRVPQSVLEMYDEVGKRLSPEEMAADKRRAADAKAAEEEAHAAAAARAAQEARRRDEAEAERRARWAEFEAKKEEVWRSAAAEARDQREDVAGPAAHALTGASTWVRSEEAAPRSQPTKEEVLEDRDRAFGLAPPEGPSPAELREEQEYCARDGAAADRAAREEAWEKAEQARRVVEGSLASRPTI